MVPNEREKTHLADDAAIFGTVDPLIGKTMGGRWEVTEFLGEGSMSVVYKAQDLETSKIVVLKILHHHLVANAKSLKRFEQRAKSLILLDHPSVAKVEDIHLTPDGQVVLIIEQLKGESLEDLLAKTGHLAVDHATEIFSQSCDALEYAHSVDVLHRDLKPSNIVLLETGSFKDDVKLVDFGIARLLSDEGDDQRTTGYITRTREVFGSPMYMSPEQCMGKRLDARSDIYALGCVMYETLTGKPPFVGKNVLETAYKHMNEAPKPLASDHASNRSLQRLETVIFKCLSKDPNLRYQLVAQLHADLKILLNAHDPVWTNNAYALKKIARVKSKERRSFTVSFEVGVLAAAASLFITVVGLWTFFFLGSEAQQPTLLDDDNLFAPKDVMPGSDMPDTSSKIDDLLNERRSMEAEHNTQSAAYKNTLMQLIANYDRCGKEDDAAKAVADWIGVISKTGFPKVNGVAEKDEQVRAEIAKLPGTKQRIADENFKQLDKQSSPVRRGEIEEDLGRLHPNLRKFLWERDQLLGKQNIAQMCDYNSIPIAYVRQARFFFSAHQYNDAEKSAVEALNIFDKEGVISDRNLAEALDIMGLIYSTRGRDLSKAAPYFERLYRLAAFNKYNMDFASYLIYFAKLADTYRRLDRLTLAEQVVKEALNEAQTRNLNEEQIRNMPLRLDTTQTARLLAKSDYIYGMILAKENKYSEAVAAYKDALAMNDLALQNMQTITELRKKYAARNKQSSDDTDEIAGGLVDSDITDKKQSDEKKIEEDRQGNSIRKRLGDCLWHTNWIDAIKFKFGKDEKSTKSDQPGEQNDSKPQP